MKPPRVSTPSYTSIACAQVPTVRTICSSWCVRLPNSASSKTTTVRNWASRPPQFVCCLMAIALLLMPLHIRYKSTLMIRKCLYPNTCVVKGAAPARALHGQDALTHILRYQRHSGLLGGGGRKVVSVFEIRFWHMIDIDIRVVCAHCSHHSIDVMNFQEGGGLDLYPMQVLSPLAIPPLLASASTLCK